MSYKRTTRRAIEMARAAGFDTAVYVGQWKGRNVYEPRFNDDVMRYMGFPQFILASGKTLRWTADNDESIFVLKALQST